MHRSVEAGFIESMIEGDTDAAQERLRGLMLDGELIEFYETISKSMDLVIEELDRRGLKS